MAISIQFLLGLLIVTQTFCLQHSQFILENGEKFAVHDTSVKFENFFFNYTHVESLVEYKIEGAIGSNVTNLALVLDTVSSINLDDESKPFLTKCDISLREPNDEFSQQVFRALKNLIYNTTCINANRLNDLAFDSIVGNNEVHLNTITSSLRKVGENKRDNISKHDEHQRGVDTIVDRALNFILGKLKTFNSIHISEFVAPTCTVRNLTLENVASLTRTQPLKMYRTNDTLTLDAAFKIKPILRFTAMGHLWGFKTSERKFMVSADKIESRIKLNLDYSVVPCRIKLIDMSYTKENLKFVMEEKGWLAMGINLKVAGMEYVMLPEIALPVIKYELQKMLDLEYLRSEAESLRPIFLHA